MKLIKGALRNLSHWAGYEISRLPTAQSSAVWTPPPHALVHHHIDLVFDVGANAGQFACEMRSKMYMGYIVSFEPLPDAHTKLMETAIGDAKWFVHPRCALGAVNGEAEINVSSNSFSSSFRPILKAHTEAAPHSAYNGSFKSPVATLDSVFHSYHRAGLRTCLKIDTQGYEREVLHGAAACLSEICMIQLEMSLVPLYEGQALYQELFHFMWDRGFSLWTVEPAFMNLETGRLLQIDAIFVREPDFRNNETPSAS